MPFLEAWLCREVPFLDPSLCWDAAFVNSSRMGPTVKKILSFCIEKMEIHNSFYSVKSLVTKLCMKFPFSDSVDVIRLREESQVHV